ncbi:hypothetical protein SEA_BANTAM_10 [Gordonia phage Bantam]|uniref:Uncharacterized protein n=1 Tax=Gordonia phage Bantam TaxID=1887641 RepID=A0A1B3AY81_9CAUD|nr:hypothetical protein BIZ77_gp168 [Gordonia phage Bantam]AOE43700.1 hypothetical protein SEA_BANTAM_10 [Gordonia phage Bantam]
MGCAIVARYETERAKTTHPFWVRFLRSDVMSAGRRPVLIPTWEF